MADATPKTRVTVLGLGPVGLATAWNLLREGHHVDAFDLDSRLAELYSNGSFPKTPALAEELRQELGRRLFIHKKPDECLANSHFVVCVETPTRNGEFDLSAVKAALNGILKRDRPRTHIILRSTLLPGTLGRLNIDCDLSYYPEFLRMPCIREDLLEPPLRVAAHSSPQAKKSFLSLFPEADQELPDFATAEAVKIACNAFHALKVVFANEMGDLCERSGISPALLMDTLCRDTKLNLSEKYLAPGGPFEGPCLDKDLQALEGFLDRKEVAGDLLRSIRISNEKRRNRRNPPK